MHRKKSRASLITICLVVSLGLFVCSLPTLAVAQSTNGPKRRLPGRREGAGTRGSCNSVNIPLTALIPDTNLGLTTSEYPTFFWYIPKTAAKTAEFVLNDGTKDIYKTSFAIAGTPGIVSLTLPKTTTLPPLEVGKNYSWSFALICDPEESSSIDFVQGWVQRVVLNPSVSAKLEKAAPRDRPGIYASAGIWNDALMSLAELRRAKPNDSVLAKDWESILKSVGLTKVAREAFIPCCTQANTQEANPTSGGLVPANRSNTRSSNSR